MYISIKKKTAESIFMHDRYKNDIKTEQVLTYF